MSTLASKIKEARIKANMSEKELARKCGVSPSYIIEVESGKKIVNEKTAEKILSVFGERVGFNFDDQIEAEKKTQKPVEKKVVKPVVEPPLQMEPTVQWEGALANVIKKFPITDLSNGKTVGYKELPILNKRVDGVIWDRLMFIKNTEADLESLRIKPGDVIQINMTKEIFNKSIYLVELGGKKLIRRVTKEMGNQVALTRGTKNETPIMVPISELKLIGQCLKVEFSLESI